MPAMDLDTDAADAEAAALKQRELHGQAGRGPRIDADVPTQGASATDAVAQGYLKAGAPENTAEVVAERITRPLGKRSIVAPAPPRSAAETSAQLHGNALAAAQQRHLAPEAGTAVIEGGEVTPNPGQEAQLDTQAESRTHHEPPAGSYVGNAEDISGHAPGEGGEEK